MLGPHEAVLPVVPRPLAEAPIRITHPAPLMPPTQTSEYYAELGREVRLLRETLGLAPRQWASIFEVAVNTARRWEAGQARGAALLGARPRRVLARVVHRVAVRRRLVPIWELVRPLMDHAGIPWPPLPAHLPRRMPRPPAVRPPVPARPTPAIPPAPPLVRWGRDQVPPCLDSLREWQLYYRASKRAQRSPWPCALCTPEYQAEMTAAGRCSNPHLRLQAPPLPRD